MMAEKDMMVELEVHQAEVVEEEQVLLVKVLS